MATVRSKAPWIAPRTGGYSAKETVSGRSMAKPVGSDTVTKHPKPSPPRGRAAASTKTAA